MQPINRPASPECLERNADVWTARYIAERAGTPPRQFRWYDENCYQAIRFTLLQMTAQRCAYCGGLLGVESRPTVDHVVAKTVDPNLAFEWTNMLPACDMCQQAKRNKDIPNLLRPDEPGYRFEDYFICDFLSGEVLPNPAALPEVRERAAQFLDAYDVNIPARNSARIRERRISAAGNILETQELNYRYFVSIED